MNGKNFQICSVQITGTCICGSKKSNLDIFTLAPPPQQSQLSHIIITQNQFPSSRKGGGVIVTSFRPLLVL